MKPPNPHQWQVGLRLPWALRTWCCVPNNILYPLMPLAALGPSFLAMFGVILLPSVSVFMPQTPLLIILTPSVGSQGEDYEATVHVARRFICNMPSNNIFVKLDFSNDFNFLRRDFILERVHEVFPEFYKFCHLAYNHHSMLQCGKFSITLEEGTQQDDLLGVHQPLMFYENQHSCPNESRFSSRDLNSVCFQRTFNHPEDANLAPELLLSK